MRLACSEIARSGRTYNVNDGVQLHLPADETADNFDVLGRKLLRSACVDLATRVPHSQEDTSAQGSDNRSTSSHHGDGHRTQPRPPICRRAWSNANKPERPTTPAQPSERVSMIQPMLLACDTQTTRNEPLTGGAAATEARRFPAAREDMLCDTGRKKLC